MNAALEKLDPRASRPKINKRADAKRLVGVAQGGNAPYVLSQFRFSATTNLREKVAWAWHKDEQQGAL
jgi:hypothetical protein